MSVETLETDVLIIGSGVAGLAAALAARAETDRVTLVTQGAVGRRSVSFYSGGQFALHLPPSGEDGLRAWFEASPLTNRAVARSLAREAATQIQGLTRYGVAVRSSPEGGYSIGRLKAEQRASPSAALMAGMARAARAADVQMIPAFTLTRLLAEDGVCRGAVGFTAGGDWIAVAARATVVAAGGVGRLYRHGVGMAGDGHAALLRAGARLVNMEFPKFFPLGLPTVQFPPHRPSRRFYDLEGLRAINAQSEDVYQKHLGQTIKVAMEDLYDRFVTMSSIVAREQRIGPVMLDFSRVPPAVRAEMASAGILALVARWGGSPGLWRQLLRHPAIPTTPIHHSLTGGAQVGEDMSTGVVGLFAGGEVVDVFSDLGSKPSYETGPLPCALTTGHIAGRAAGAFAAQARRGQLSGKQVEAEVARVQAPLQRSDGVAPRRVMRELTGIVSDHAGPVRSCASMLEGLERLDRVEPQLARLRSGNYAELAGAVGAQSMALAARAILQAALLREESRSEHVREDFPSKDDNGWRKHVVVEIGRDGELAVNAVPI